MTLTRWVAAIVAFAAVAAACAIVAWPLIYPDATMAEYSSWEPTATTIAKRLGTQVSTDFRDHRHAEFAQLFEQRFRTHDIAVHVQFEPDNWVELQCAAAVDPWCKARIAVQLCEEVSTVLGRHVTVEIYDTYLSTAGRKVGEAEIGENGGRVNVVFDPALAAEDERSGRTTDVLKPIDPPSVPDQQKDGAHEARRPTNP